MPLILERYCKRLLYGCKKRKKAQIMKISKIVNPRFEAVMIVVIKKKSFQEFVPQSSSSWEEAV